MGGKREGSQHSFRQELRLILKRSRQVWRLVSRRHKWALGGATAVMMVGSACNTLIAILVGKAVTGVEQGTRQGLSGQTLFRIAIFFLGLLAGTIILREVLQVLRRYLVENTCCRIEKGMTVRLVAHLLKVDLASLTHEKVGALNGRIQRSVVGFVRLIRLMFTDFLPAVLTGLFALVVAVQKQPWLGLMMSGVIPVSIALTVWQLISQKGVRLRLIRSREVMDGTVVEQLGGIDYVRVADTHNREVERVARAAERRRARETRHHFEMSLFGCAKALNEGLFHILVLSYAIYLFAEGQVDSGMVFTFSGLFVNVMTPLNEVHRILDESHECSLLVGDLLEILAEPIDPSFFPKTVQEPELVVGAPLIEADNLQVEYLTAKGKRVRALDGLSLTIRHGETIGVAGPSGGGKSTWLRVLMRLTHPCGGQLRLAGAPLERVSRGTIGRLVGYVGQYPFIFSGTIAENIAYGTEEATPAQIEEAARKAHIHDEIMALDKGYATVLAERGQNLSGGQRQRLALARVLLREPPILILDEGTSALDNISERHVQQVIEQARGQRTVIMVAHRLSTLVNTDRIYVFNQGRVAEEGTFGEVVLKGGLLAQLVQSAGHLEGADAPAPEPPAAAENTPAPPPAAAPGGETVTAEEAPGLAGAPVIA